MENMRYLMKSLVEFPVLFRLRFFHAGGGLTERRFADTIRNVIKDADGNISSTKPVRSMEFHAINYENLRAEKSIKNKIGNESTT